ncbi:uncharacterized protein L201_003978 [Kwoniella dendrophila CBS 6074]|uniref:Uncharacterized protein n=1 Tax=Kwoniella dendrophila CBS 6074 TaxID=1295534 RepID=A0AAX4JWY0_9TREE
MLEHIPGITLPSDGSVCLAQWLMIIIESTLAIIAIITITLIILTIRECVLIYRSKKEKQIEENEHGLLKEKAEDMGIIHQQKD